VSHSAVNFDRRASPTDKNETESYSYDTLPLVFNRIPSRAWLGLLAAAAGAAMRLTAAPISA
jgi:hypothetical protein